MEEGSEELLSCPTTTENDDFKKTYSRGSCSYRNLCGKFRLLQRDYVTQYAHIYFTRLEKMRSYLEKAATEKWGRFTTYLGAGSNLRRSIFYLPLNFYLGGGDKIYCNHKGCCCMQVLRCV